MWKLELLTDQLETLLDTVVTVFVNAHSHQNISDSTISGALVTIQNYQAKTQTLNSNLNNAKQKIDSTFLSLQNTYSDIASDLEQAQLNLDNTLSGIETNLVSAELRMENATRTTNESNISKHVNLNIQYAQLEQAKLRVEKAQYELSLADLKAPKAGTIIEVNASVGESLKAESTSSDNAFIKILSDANFTTEVYVEEIDIASIIMGQKALVTLDAIPDAKLEGAVSYIASTATTDNNGIVTYLVRIDITDTKDEPIREGMTTYVDFVLGEVLDVIVVPTSAVMQNRFVLTEAGKRVRVETGFSDGDFVEIKSGLEVGDKIISNPEGGNTTANGPSGSGRTLSVERMEAMKAAGFTDEELQKLQNGEFTDDMRTKMQAMREATVKSGSITNTSDGRRGMGGGRPRQ